MKNLTLIFLVTLLAFSCVKNPSPNLDPDEQYKDVIVNLTSTSLYSVPIRDGYTTVVTYKGQILAVTSKAMDIMVPKEAVLTKSDGDFTIFYRTGTTDVSTSYLWQTIAFEDSKLGDFDYNDLIIHSKYEVSDNSLLVSVHPIAFGATKQIKLGFEWHQGASSGREIVADDCRSELFNGKSGFINTVQYDIKYSDFVKDVSVTLPSSSEAVEIIWFIVVDGNVEIFAVNQSGYDCIDEDGMPYGFAITDAGNGAVNLPGNAPQASAPMTKASYSSWSDVQSLFVFPAEPDASVYSSLPTLDSYKAWGDASLKDYYVAAGQTFNGDVNLTGNSFYIAGEMTITNSWGSGASFYVFEGGVLNLTQSSLQNIHLYCYGGTVNFPKNETLISTGSQFFFDGNLICKGDLAVEQDAVLFVGNRIEANKATFRNNSKTYLGCCLYVTDMIDITNSAAVYVTHYLNAPKLKMSESGSIYVNGDLDGGCLLDVTELFHSANGTNKVECIGNDYAVFNIQNYLLDGYSQGTNTPYDLSSRLIGNLDVHYQAISAGGQWVGNDPAVQLVVSGEIKINGNTSLPATDCHPAFGESGGQGGGSETATGDSGLCWWKFPMERVDINSCYSFDSWARTGEFNFRLLEGAQVFDIFDEEPLAGAGRIYDL